MAKDLYIVSSFIDEESIWFCSMTEKQAKEMLSVLKEFSGPHGEAKVEKIVDSPGYQTFEGLMKDFRDVIG